MHAVARHGTVGAAATALNMTASALSQQLAKLEREVGQPLLVRRGRGVALTDAGVLLVEHTEALLARMAQAETELQAQRGQAIGRMAIAAFATATRAVLPAALRELREQYPHLQLESYEHDPVAALELLLRGNVDIAVIDEWFRPRPDLPEGVQAEHLLDDVADLALPADHRLARADKIVDLGACADERWITWGDGVFGHDWLRRELRKHRPDPVFAHTASEHQTLLALVAAGLGVALVPRLGRGPVPDGVVVKPVGPTATRRVFALWRTDTAARPAIGAARTALRHAALVGAAARPTTALPTPVASAPEDRPPVTIGHRGAARTAPENTVAAFQAARSADVDCFEIDVQLSADGVPFVFHDDTPARTTNVVKVFPGRKRNPVTSFTWAELQRLDAGSWFGGQYAGQKIPHLDDAARIAAPGTGVYIEIKRPADSPGIEQVVADALKTGRDWAKLVAAGKVTVIGFDEASNRRFAEIAPEIPLQQLSRSVPDAATLERWARFVDSVGTDHRRLDAEGVARVKAAGLDLGVYTVTSPKALQRVLALGVDMVTGDFPIQARR